MRAKYKITLPSGGYETFEADGMQMQPNGALVLYDEPDGVSVMDAAAQHPMQRRFVLRLMYGADAWKRVEMLDDPVEQRETATLAEVVPFPKPEQEDK